MTMSKIIDKLRRKNRDNYRILSVCIFLSVLLVTSFAVMYFSPSVQGQLPPGGDTRKLAWLLLGATCIGCAIFTVYGAGLFFKYKSREFGVMLALGERKKRLGRRLAADLAAVIARSTALGLIAALPASYLIWKLFTSLLITSGSMRYSYSPAGHLAGVLYALALTLVIVAAGRRFIRRADIMEILNDRRRTELVREINPHTGRIGVILIILGLFLAMAVPPILVRLFLFLVPSVWNLTYLLCVAGIYLLMLSAVGSRKAGRRPEKYYRNIISTNLMRFTARQTTRNMCVITLLVFVLLISVFWGAMYYNSAFSAGEEARYDFSLHFPAVEEQITREDILRLAEKHEVAVTEYQEAQALNLNILYTNRDMHDNGSYFDLISEKLALFMAASDFSRLSGQPVNLSKGQYKTIVRKDYRRTVWVGPDCLETVTGPGERSLQPEYAGMVEFGDLNSEVSDPFVFVLSDEDYLYLGENASDADKEKLILFSAADSAGVYDFAMEWRSEYIGRATSLSDHINVYDAREEELAAQSGREYYASMEAGVSKGDPNLLKDWKYAPFSKILSRAEAMQRIAVFVLLSLYIAVISLAAVGVMTYVRSLTIAMDNRQLFEDLKRLGADRAYRDRALRMQLRRIFAYPALAGSLLVILFALFLTVFNDMRLQPFEITMLLMEVCFIALNGLYFYTIYRISREKARSVIFS